MKKAYILLIFVFALTMACNSDQESNNLIFTIASTKVDCQGVAPQKCLQIKKNTQKEWEYFYRNIEGFNYEEGYEYVIEVSQEKIKNPPADGSSIKYKFVKLISKTKK